MRRVVILCTVPLLIAAAVAAGLVWNAQQNRSATPQLGPGGAPQASGAASDEEALEQKAAKAISDCRREVALAESVLAAAGDGIGHWREYVQAQTDLTLGRNSEDQAEDVWKRTRQAGPTDIAKYQTAKSGYRSRTEACEKLGGVETAQADHLTMCRTRLGKVASALTNADLTMKDWENHLVATRGASDDEVHESEEAWLETWRKAPGNLDKYATAMDTLAKTKSCPR